MKTVSALATVALLVAGCGGGSPTGPSGSQFPSVAGNYSGATTMTFPEVNETVTCPTTTSVTQSGTTVSIAPLVLTGACTGFSILFGSVTINETGAFPAMPPTTVNEPSCGTYNVVGSGGFFGRELRLSITATSATCFNFNMTVSVSR